MHADDFADITEALVFHPGFDQAAVDARKAHCASAALFEQVDQRLVDLSGQHHLDDIHGFLIGDAQAVHENRGLAQFLHQIGNLRPAAVHQHDFDADQP